MERDIYTVEEVSRYIGKTVESNPFLRNMWIKGEISNFANKQHLYFSVKDGKSTIPAIMFQGHAGKLKFIPKNGMKVIVKANVAFYEPQAKLQINVVAMEEDGIGDLELKFRQLKEKLAAEGLFDSASKKTIPRMPKVIGVLTSPTGAVIHDIMTTLKRRYPLAKVVFHPIAVQGEQAPKSICEGIRLMNRYHAEKEPVDVLIVGRGGGSIEDLWGFNDEKVARALSECVMPTISAVGHETDITIADFVADLRAPTPTAAAEMASPVSVNELIQRFTFFETSLHRQMEKQVKGRLLALSSIERHLQLLHPKKKWETDVQRLDHMQEKLMDYMNRLVERKYNQFERAAGKLELISPLKTMQRGYTISFKGDSVVRSVHQVEAGDDLRILVEDGEIEVLVKNKKEENRNDTKENNEL